MFHSFGGQMKERVEEKQKKNYSLWEETLIIVHSMSCNKFMSSGM